MFCYINEKGKVCGGKELVVGSTVEWNDIEPWGYENEKIAIAAELSDSDFVPIEECLDCDALDEDAIIDAMDNGVGIVSRRRVSQDDFDLEQWLAEMEHLEEVENEMFAAADSDSDFDVEDFVSEAEQLADEIDTKCARGAFRTRVEKNIGLEMHTHGSWGSSKHPVNHSEVKVNETRLAMIECWLAGRSVIRRREGMYWRVVVKSSMNKDHLGRYYFVPVTKELPFLAKDYRFFQSLRDVERAYVRGEVGRADVHNECFRFRHAHQSWKESRKASSQWAKYAGRVIVRDTIRREADVPVEREAEPVEHEIVAKLSRQAEAVLTALQWQSTMRRLDVQTQAECDYPLIDGRSDTYDDFDPIYDDADDGNEDFVPDYRSKSSDWDDYDDLDDWDISNDPWAGYDNWDYVPVNDDDRMWLDYGDKRVDDHFDDIEAEHDREIVLELRTRKLYSSFRHAGNKHPRRGHERDRRGLQCGVSRQHRKELARPVVRLPLN